MPRRQLDRDGRPAATTRHGHAAARRGEHALRAPAVEHCGDLHEETVGVDGRGRGVARTRAGAGSDNDERFHAMCHVTGVTLLHTSRGVHARWRTPHPRAAAVRAVHLGSTFPTPHLRPHRLRRARVARERVHVAEEAREVVAGDVACRGARRVAAAVGSRGCGRAAEGATAPTA